MGSSSVALIIGVFCVMAVALSADAAAFSVNFTKLEGSAASPSQNQAAVCGPCPKCATDLVATAPVSNCSAAIGTVDPGQTKALCSDSKAKRSCCCCCCKPCCCCCCKPCCCCRCCCCGGCGGAGCCKWCPCNF